MAFTIRVNGTMHSLDVGGDAPLLLGLVRGSWPDRHQIRPRHSAARRLHVARRLPRAPGVTPVQAVGGSKVTTIGAEVQKAWLDRKVPAVWLRPSCWEAAIPNRTMGCLYAKGLRFFKAKKTSHSTEESICREQCPSIGVVGIEGECRSQKVLGFAKTSLAVAAQGIEST